MKKLITSLFILVLVFSLIGCSSSESSSSGKESEGETTLEKVKREGKVTVGFANEIPYAYKTPDGELTGLGVEVARAVFKRMGINEMEGVLTEFGSMIPAVKAKRFDIITAGMYITPERAKEVDFANPEYSIGESIGVKVGNPFNIKSYEDIKNNKDIKVAVLSGTVEQKYLLKVGVSEDQIKLLPDLPSAFSALKSGRVDVVATTRPSLKDLLDKTKDSGIEIVEDFVQPVIDGKSVRSYGATVFRQEDDDFREAFNKELEVLKESGELLEILEKFGLTEQELPGDVKAEELLKD
ncbi:ectoine/hydroxyectoine ABC transporter substrate-binding protein EhuB [Ammoniphilus sp. 3BR4]|uniref:ectoine/hydroxyectoine ABC transporter substrate-binding protein EhuB n=1 Tax=Ammoniphilus sp. 3BR4 TaxID=3158265 RepID=UPI003465D651